jgi:hypothetical protein
MSDAVQKEVDKLLKNREKYEGWLKRLESEKTATTERAYERVRVDYQARLDEVTNQLRSHSDTINGKLGQLEASVADLEAQRAAKAEELDEAQLRRSVGEFRDDKEWGDLENQLLSSMRDAEREVERSRIEIQRLREIVTLVKGAEAQPAPRPQPAPPPQAQPMAPPPPPAVDLPEPAPAPPPARQPVAGGAAAEEGFLSLEELVLEDTDPTDVLGAEPVSSPLPEAQPFPEPGPPPAPESADPFAETDISPPPEPSPPEGGVTDELAFLESLSLGGGEEAPGSDAQSFSFLEQHGSGTPQTIICPHCSAANDPAEWYCTECGEELPAE